jgi:hypothetical protein
MPRNQTRDQSGWIDCEAFDFMAVGQVDLAFGMTTGHGLLNPRPNSFIFMFILIPPVVLRAHALERRRLGVLQLRMKVLARMKLRAPTQKADTGKNMAITRERNNK